MTRTGRVQIIFWYRFLIPNRPKGEGSASCHWHSYGKKFYAQNKAKKILGGGIWPGGHTSNLV